MEIVDVVSEGRSGVTPGFSGAPQWEQKRLFSALRLPHLEHTRADMDGSSCAAARRGRGTRTDRSGLRPHLGSTAVQHLCRPTAQGRRRPRPSRPGTADAGLPHRAVRGDERSRCRRPLAARSCRTTSQTTSRAIPLDRNRPARGAGRTLTEHIGRPGHLHNVRLRQTVSTTHHPFGAPTPATSCPGRTTPMHRRFTGRTTERSQAASALARRPQRSCPTAPR